MNSLLAIETNPGMGILFFTLGGLAGAVFYLPLNKVKNWAWESYWMIYAVVGLLIVPWVLAYSTSPNLMSVLMASPRTTLMYCFICGAAWGFGGLTWGLMIRYLGVGLGLAIGCGLVMSVGTLVPKIIAGEFGDLFNNVAGISSFIGILVTLAGIILVGMAGMSKEGELSEEEKKKSVAEFNFKLGIIVAIFSGIMSAAMNFGLQGGPLVEHKAQYGSKTQIIKGEAETIPQEFMETKDSVVFDKKTKYWVLPGTSDGEKLTAETWKGMPVLVVVLLGGLMVNFLWCLFLNFKNKTMGDYCKKGAPLVSNLALAGLAGAIWCSQFICFKTGEPRMGNIAYVGWQVLFASMIIFSTLLGILLGEWNGTSKQTRWFLAMGLVLLVASTVVAGYSGYLSQS